MLAWCLGLHVGPLHPRCSTARMAVEVVDATLADAEMLTALTVNGLVGELGNDYGFNNNRAMAYYSISAEQSHDIRPSLASKACITLKAISDEQLVGFVRIRPARASDPYPHGMVLDNLVVDSSMRRQGVAARLMEAAEARVQRLGNELTLWVDEDNNPARAFYLDRGWVEKSDGLADATRYRLDWWKGSVVEACKRVTMRRQ